MESQETKHSLQVHTRDTQLARASENITIDKELFKVNVGQI